MADSSSALQDTSPVTVAIGTKNAAKRKAVELVSRIAHPCHPQPRPSIRHSPLTHSPLTSSLMSLFSACPQAFASVFPRRPLTTECFDVPSGVLPQPLTAPDTLTGATNRSLAAQRAYHTLHTTLPDFALGLEGGIETIPPPHNTHLECGYIVCRHSSGRQGVGRSASYQVSGAMMDRLGGGRELGDVIDELSGAVDVRQSEGMMGIITNSALPRAECYAHGVIFALAPFVSAAVYWDPLPAGDQPNGNAR